MGPSLFAQWTGALWRMYADRRHNSWKKTFVWDMIEPYRRPKSFTPVVSIYVAAFYTGIIGSAITEQLYKEYILDLLVILWMETHSHGLSRIGGSCRYYYRSINWRTGDSANIKGFS